MDSWIYNGMSSGKNVFLSEEVDYPVEDHNCKSKLTGNEYKPNSNIENYPLISNTQALDRLDFMDLGFTDEIRKSYSISSEPSGEVFSDEVGTDYHPQERESSEFNQSNNQDFSLVDLKLGSLADCGIASSCELSRTDVLESSMMCSNLGKKARQTTSFGVRSTVCQVLGCNKDLGSFKSYYKRHKVCDVHTKTPKVVVDGVEQRFCQQCSRFHLLNEFDDIKRSCRRRLAAHNKRRRRPQLTAEPGSGIIDFSSSLAFPEEMPNVFLGSSSKYEASEDSLKSSNFLPQMDKISPNTNGNLFPPIQNSTTSIQHQNSRARALSLLSAQSQSSHNADSIIPGHHSAGTTARISRSGPHPSRIFSGEGPTGKLDPSNGGSSDCVDPKGRGMILNLMQLSSHLERVENQRQYSTENEAG